MSGVIYLTGEHRPTHVTELADLDVQRTEGYGRSHPGFVDMSDYGARRRIDLAGILDGPIPADPSGTGPPAPGELGTPFGRYRLYSFYQDGLIFENGPIETMDLEGMLAADGHMRAIEQALTLPPRGASWQFKKAKGDSGELDFVTDAFTRPPEDGGMRTPLQTVIGQMAGGRLFKRAHFEKVVEVGTDGKLRYTDLAYRPPSTCYLARMATDGSFAGFMQWSWKGLNFVKVMIPARKAFVYVHGTHRNPLEGVSDLDVAYNVWQSKQKIRFLWYQFLETQAAPRMTVTHSVDDSPAIAALARKAATLKGGGVLGLAPGQTAAVLESNGMGAGEFQQAIQYLDSEAYASVNAGFLNMTANSRSSARGSSASSGHSSGSGAGGMYQAAEQFFQEGGQSVLAEIQAQFTTYVVAPLVRWNFGAGAAVPTFEFGNLADTDSSQQAVALLTSIASAATPTPLLPLDFIDQLVVKVAGMLDMNVDELNSAMKELTAGRKGAMTPADIAEAQGQTAPSSALVHNTVDGLAQVVANRMPAPPALAGVPRPVPAAA